MARGTLPVSNIKRSASTKRPAEVVGDATNGHQFANGDTVFLTVRNAHATVTKTVTVKLTATVDGQSVTSKTYPIPATEEHDLGPFPADKYGTTVLVDVESTDIKLSVRRLA